MLGNLFLRPKAFAVSCAKILAMGAALGFPGGAMAQQAGALACLQLVEALANDGRVPLQGVHFDFNRATLRPDSLPALVAARDAILTLGGAWSFEGHTDSVGSRDYNQRLSESRALAVRDWMIGAGIDAGQVSFAGFSFDRPIADNATEAGRALNRRVELVGTVTPDMLGFGGPEGIDPCPDTLTLGTHGPTAEAEAPPPPPEITEWSAHGGQEWLPFSSLAPTALGGGEGWQGDRIIMPPGTQPQACQALCLAEDRCAAFSFEPAGSYFVAEARCNLIGYGSEMRIDRHNGYHDGGTFFASGLKPDARLLTPESEEIAAQILADMAEIAELRATVTLSAAAEISPETWLDVALNGHVPVDRYTSFVEIAELGDYAFEWFNSRGSVFVQDIDDGRGGQIWTPDPGDYELRYVIDHPTAGRHTILSQSLIVRAGAIAAPAPAQSVAEPATAAPARTGTVEPNFDRPGMDIAQTPMTVADPLACQALCASDANCQSWTYVNPGLQGEQAMCWTKSGVPDGSVNPCCTSGVMDAADQTRAPQAPLAPAPVQAATLSAPMVLTPGESFEVRFTGPGYSGDWIDIITPGNEADMSGGHGWQWATGDTVTLTAPGAEGEYTLRYVAEHPDQGRVVLARETLVVRAAPSQTVAAAGIFRRCDGDPMTLCDIEIPEHDVVLKLTGGFGITAPFLYETAGGVIASRPSFDIVRLSDGVVVMTVNERQGSGVYCQDGVSGDAMCITHGFDSNDGIIAGIVMSTLSSFSFAAHAQDAGEDESHSAGPLQGIWAVSVNEGHPKAGRMFLRVELIQDLGDTNVEGNFEFAATFDALPDGVGDATGQVSGNRLTLTLTDDLGRGAPVLTLDRWGDVDWLGRLNTGQDEIPVRFSRLAGPGEYWDGDLVWTQRDPMAEAMALGAGLLEGLLGEKGGLERLLGDQAAEVTDEDRTMLQMLGRVMGGAADALGGTDGAPGGDAAAVLGQLFGMSDSPATTTPAQASPQMETLGGTVLDISAEEALEIFAPHLRN